MSTLLAWTDLETTGSGPGQDFVLEVGCTLTTSELNVIESFHRVIKTPCIPVTTIDPVVLAMHGANGLWADCASEHAVELHDADIDLAHWLTGWAEREVPAETIRLAGSGVSHFDSGVIRARMVETWNVLAGYNAHVKPTVDVGVIRRFLLLSPKTAGIVPEWVKNSDVPHRALDDVARFIDEAKTYRTIIGEALA